MSNLTTPAPAIGRLPALEGNATVVYPDGRIRTVRNLGWLLRHAGDVRAITFGFKREGDSPSWYGRYVLVAELEDGTVYGTPFADRRVAAQWLARPSLYRVPLLWFGSWTVTGDPSTFATGGEL